MTINKMINAQKYDLAKFFLLILPSLREKTINKINPTNGIEKSNVYPKYAQGDKGLNRSGPEYPYLSMFLLLN